MTLYMPLEGLVELIHQRKHHPGRHPQDDHTPHAYRHRQALAELGGGTPVTMEWLSKPLQQEMFEQYYPPEQRRLKQALIDGGITQEDMEGFQFFSDVPLLGDYKYDHEGTLHKGGLPIAGVYFSDHGAIHISKKWLYGDPEDLKKTVVHEMGHHKIDQMGFSYKMARIGQAADVIRRANLKSYNADQLANAGLRSYSTTSGSEMLADSFTVMRLGTPDQKVLLTNIWGEAKFTSLEQVFGYKQALDLVFAQELRAVPDEGAVDLTMVPMMVTGAVYSKTPWYYVDAT